jgi:putative ABC transport system permease protein
MARTPLAWCNLTHDRVRFGLFVLGITFAVVLMFVQLGFRYALLDSNTLMFDHARADLILVAPNRQTLAMRETFPRRRLVQAEGVNGVESAWPVYLENAITVIRDTDPDPARRGPNRVIRVIGLDPDAQLLDLPELDPNQPNSLVPALRMRNVALYDLRSKPDPEQPGRTLYGPFAPGIATELTGKAITLGGGFRLGPDFTADGTLIVSEQTFLEILRRPFSYGSPSAGIDFGFVRLKPGADLRRVQQDLRVALATGERDEDVEVLTVPEMRDREQMFWKNNTPIGFAFGFGMFMGFAVGLIICYQILSGDVSDHLAEYATLKAMGYGNLYLAWVVIQEALILAVIGFLVGWLFSWGIYEALSASTGLPMIMTWDRVLGLFLATVSMCVLSGLVALIGLVRADPADVFG